MKEISGRHIRAMTFIMCMGSAYLLGGTEEAGRESWIAALTAAIPIAVLLALISLVLSARYNVSEKDFYGLARERLGAAGEKAFALLIGAYALVSGAALMGNCESFIYVYVLPETPKIVVGIVFGAAACAAAFFGTRAGAVASRPIMYITLIVGIATTLVSLRQISPENFPLPILGVGVNAIARGALSLTAMPFSDIIILLPLLPPPDGRRRRSRDIAAGAALGWGLLSVVFLRNVLVLGERSGELATYRSYMAVRMLSIGEFFQRIESLVSFVYIICDAFKLTICVASAAAALERLTGAGRKWFYIPSAGLMIAGARLFFGNEQQFMTYAEQVKYVLPLASAAMLLLLGLAGLKPRKPCEARISGR